MKEKNFGIKIFTDENTKPTFVKTSPEIERMFDQDRGKGFGGYLKEFLGSDENYKKASAAINKGMHDSLDLELVKSCKHCQQTGYNAPNEKACTIQMAQMGITFALAANEFVGIILHNKAIFRDSKIIFELTVSFYNSFRWINGEGFMYFKLEELHRTALNAGFLSLATILQESDTLTSISIINNALDHLEDQHLSNKTLQKEDENYLDLQIAFFKSKRRFYKDKIFIEERNGSVRNKTQGKKEPTIIHYALYYYYLQKAGDFPYFENHPSGKVAAIRELIEREKINTTDKYFQLKYNFFSHYDTNRVAKNQIANIQYVIKNMLNDFPKASKIAQAELLSAQKKHR